MAEMVSRWKRVSSELTQELQRNATPEEIADQLSLDSEKAGAVQKAIDAAYSSSLSSSWRSRDADEDLDELLARAGKSSDRKSDAIGADDETKLKLLLCCLEDREGEVVKLRYGLGCDEAKTLDAIGEAFEPPITRERVRQIETNALQAMLKILDEEESRAW